MIPFAYEQFLLSPKAGSHAVWLCQSLQPSSEHPKEKVTLRRTATGHSRTLIQLQVHSHLLEKVSANFTLYLSPNMNQGRKVLGSLWTLVGDPER